MPEFIPAVPYMHVSKYSEQTGISVDAVKGMIKRNQIASVMVGRHRMVDMFQEFKDAMTRLNGAAQ
jgi:hypothetical protein